MLARVLFVLAAGCVACRDPSAPDAAKGIATSPDPSAVAATQAALPASREDVPPVEDSEPAATPPPDLVRVETGVERVEDVTLDFWGRPWAFATRQSGMVPLVTLDNRFRDRSGPMPIVLDDGRTGTLTVEARPCDPAVGCDRLADCGCFELDSYWLDVVDPDGGTVAQLHLWAAYGMFSLAAVDLVDGPGDELLILRTPNRGSPPVGRDLKIWRVAHPKPEALFQSEERVAGHLGPLCAGYRTRALIDLDAAQPRPVALQPELGAMDGCEVVVERSLLTEVTRSRVLRLRRRATTVRRAVLKRRPVVWHVVTAHANAAMAPRERQRRCEPWQIVRCPFAQPAATGPPHPIQVSPCLRAHVLS